MTNVNIDTKEQEKNQEAPEPEAELREMYKAGVHFGYSKSSRHPKMKPYFFGLRNNVEIFNLEKVYERLEEAVGFLKLISSKNGVMLLVSTKPETKDLIEKIAEETGMPHVADRWIGGTLTNFEVIKKRIKNFNEMLKKKEAGEFSVLSKKDMSRLDKQLMKLEKQLGGLKKMLEIPSVMLVVDPKEENSAVMEAKKTGVPIVAIMNSDCDPSRIDYPVPANDSSVASVEYLLSKLVEGYKSGKKKESIEKEK